MLQLDDEDVPPIDPVPKEVQHHPQKMLKGGTAEYAARNTKWTKKQTFCAISAECTYASRKQGTASLNGRSDEAVPGL